MKHIDKISVLSAILIMFNACAEMTGPQTGRVDNEFIPMTFSAVMDNDETKTTYYSRKVSWEAEDQITVYSRGNTIGSQFEATVDEEDATKAVFSGLSEKSDIYYAVYPSGSYDGTSTLTVNVSSEQKGVVNGIQSGTNVMVTVSSDENMIFRNVGALLRFSFQTPSDAERTATVTFKAKKATGGYHGLSGASSVTFGDDNMPVVSEGDVDHVTLVAPEGGFVSGKAYYIVVLPGEYAGFEVTYKDKDDKTFTKTNDKSCILLRNQLLDISYIPNPYPVEEGQETLLAGWSAASTLTDNISEWKASGLCAADQGNANARMSFVIDSANSDLTYAVGSDQTNPDYNTEGFYTLRKVWTNDRVEFEVPVENMSAGSEIIFRCGLRTSQHNRFWNLEYWDNEKWNLVDPVSYATAKGNTQIATIDIGKANTLLSVEKKFVLATAATTLKIRLVAANGAYGTKNDSNAVPNGTVRLYPVAISMTNN